MIFFLLFGFADSMDEPAQNMHDVKKETVLSRKHICI